MMTKDERILLANTLDALDRVFDRQSKVIDLHAILFATERALGKSHFHLAFGSPTDELGKTIRSEASEDRRRDFALRITDDLRKFIAGELRRDGTENPKQRHSR